MYTWVENGAKTTPYNPHFAKNDIFFIYETGRFSVFERERIFETIFFRTDQHMDNLSDLK